MRKCRTALLVDVAIGVPVCVDAQCARKKARDYTETKPGNTSYYVWVFQRDSDQSDGDPEIASNSLFV
jgi:hypothetical protein